MYDWLVKATYAQAACASITEKCPAKDGTCSDLRLTVREAGTLNEHTFNQTMAMVSAPAGQLATEMTGLLCQSLEAATR